MSINGYIVNLDLSDARDLVSLLGRSSNNFNQYAKRANDTGSIYAADIETCGSGSIGYGIWHGVSCRSGYPRLI